MNTIVLTTTLLVLCYVTLQVTGNGPYWNYPEFLEPQSYINNVIQSLQRRVDAYGVERLQLNDTTLKVNKTVYDIHLEGTVDYRSGVVLEIEEFSNKSMRTSVDSEDAWIDCEAWIYNASVVYDIDVKMTNFVSKGVAALRFPENYFRFTVNKKWIDNNDVVTVNSVRVMGVKAPKTDYTPTSDKMKAVARDGQLTLSTVLFPAIDDWSKDVFEDMIEDIVNNEYRFPITEVDKPRRVNSSDGA